MAVDLRELVRAERRRLGWSVRTAANRGGCSNTTWGAWENGTSELGPAVQAAVSAAFDWPADWPTTTPDSPANHPLPDDPTNGELLHALERLKGVADYMVEVLIVMAASRQIPLPSPPGEVADDPPTPSGRRKGDRP